MKLTKRIKIKVGDGIGRPRLIPNGYYKNRPSVLRKFISNGLGRIEGFRMIVS